MTAAVKSKPRKAAAEPPQEIKEVEWMKLLNLALTTPGSVGNVYNRFYEYSFMNCMLMMMQGARGPVATYNRWQELGRQVRKGEKALWIVRPITIRIKDEGGDESKDKLIPKFKFIKSPFDFSCTDGDDLPPMVIPGWSLDLAHEALNVKLIPFAAVDGNTQGYSSERTYAINPVAAYPDKTRFHELAHIVLGHTTRDEMTEYEKHRGIKEFQAEATALLVMKELGYDDGSDSVSRAYIQGWLGRETPSDAAIRQVFSAVNKIVTAGRPKPKTKED